MMSFKGKTLIVNQVAATQIFHALAVLSCPDNILDELQGMLVDFLWSHKRHLLKKAYSFNLATKVGSV